MTYPLTLNTLYMYWCALSLDLSQMMQGIDEKLATIWFSCCNSLTMSANKRASNLVTSTPSTDDMLPCFTIG